MSEFEPLKPVVSEEKPEREGLPPGYRMRADAHYVDQLTSRRSERVYTDYSRATGSHDADAPEPALRDRRDVRERRGDKVLAQIAEEVAAIEAAAALLRSPASTAAHRVAIDLLQVHAKRAAWLAGANTLLDGAPRGGLATRQIGALLMQVRDGVAAECRLAGVTLHFQADDWNVSIGVNEPEFLIGVSGAIRTTLAALADVDGGTIRVMLSVSGDALQAVDVAQDHTNWPVASNQRFFDLSWVDRPGGWVAALGAAAARALAQRDGGSAVFVPADRRGGTIRLIFAATN
jgi:hypothetical protein